MFLALLVLTQSIAALADQAVSPDERLVIEAVLRSPELISQTDGGRYDLAHDTHLSGLHCWTMPSQTETRIRLNGTNETFALSEELIASAKARNARSISVRRFTRPPRTARNQYRSVDYAKRIAVSRPGISQDGSTAIVAVEDESSGYTAYLERRAGIWSVVGRGCVWVI